MESSISDLLLNYSEDSFDTFAFDDTVGQNISPFEPVQTILCFTRMIVSSYLPVMIRVCPLPSHHCSKTLKQRIQSNCSKTLKQRIQSKTSMTVPMTMTMKMKMKM